MAKPKLCLIPSAQGDKFYSVLPSSGVGDFDFTRSGGATRINSQGLIETVADGVSRLNYPLIDGKVVGCPSHLLEPQRTNLVTHSEDFSNASWIKVQASVTSGFTSPDGATNAFKLVENTNNVAHNIYASPSITLGNNIFSVFAKAAERRVLGIEFPTNGILVSFDLIDGVFVNSQANPDGFSITPYENGWYRIDIQENLTSTSTVSLSLRDDNGNRTYQGDGTSGLYIYGAQLEQGSYPTSYIPTNGSSVTRSSETANGSGDASTFNDSEGVLMAEISALDDDLTNRRITISDNTTNNRIVLGFADTSNTILALVGSNGTQFISTISISDTKLNNKFALKYKQNDFALWVNGIEIATGTSGNTPLNLNNLKIQGSTGFSNFYGNTKQIQYFDSADIDLEKLTSWVSFSDMAEGQLYTIE